MFKDIPKFLDNEIKASIERFHLTDKERSDIYSHLLRNGCETVETIIEYGELWSDAVVGAITYMKDKNNFFSVKEKLEKLAVKSDEHICHWLGKNEDTYPLYHSYILHIEKIRLMALKYIEEQLSAEREDV